MKPNIIANTLFNPDAFEKKEVLNAFYQTALFKGYPIAIWQLPQTGIKNIAINLSKKAEITKLDLESQLSGFAFSPFNNLNGKSTIYIKSDLYFNTAKNKIIESFNLQTNPAKAAARDEFFKLLEDFLMNIQPCDPEYSGSQGKHPAPARPPVWRTGQLAGGSSIQHQEFYCQIVKKAIREIKNGIFRKLVLSRTKTFELTQKLDPLLIFEKLCNAYPNSFIYLVSIPGNPTWMGASPEILLSVDHNNIFKTTAMAGTQPLKPGTSPKKAAWTQKEIEEQALVSRFIINCFKKIRLREFEEEGPKTIIAGNLMHLRTDYTVDMNAVNFPQLGTVMLDLLHPTSAVCGMPKNESMEFILANENYNREFYTGYLGPVNMPCQVETPDATETHLFVNLRCMQLSDNKAILYAGSGITEDSEPESEWEETELKCKTILDVIGK